MTATDILQKWDSIAIVFGYKPEAWLRLIRIASSGDEGCTMRDLFPKTNGWRQLTFWRQNELIAVREVKDSMNRPQSRIFITPKGLALLRLKRA